VSADGPTLLRRIRGAMWGLALYWALAVAVTLAFPGEPMPGLEAPSLWLTAGVPGAVGLLHVVVALRFRPGARTTWGLAVSAAAFSLLGCLTTPVAGWVIWMLFRKPVMGALLGGPYAE
jgi:hypothetical protein